MYTPTPPPPAPPPKPSSHDVSRLSTPASGTPPRPPPIPECALNFDGHNRCSQADASGLIPAPTAASSNTPVAVPDPGDQWLPKILEDKSKQDLAEILGNPDLLQALTRAPSTIHPSLQATDDALLAALEENVALASHLVELESRLAHLRSAAQAQLLSTHALERQWRQKQVEMDRALEPFAPSSLYQQLTQGLQEQEMICRAMEESFLEGDGSGLATERETLDWVRKYREGKKLYYLRQERKERWNERRVGGWR